MNLSSHFKNFLLGLFLFVKFVFAKKCGLVEITSRNFQTMVFKDGKDAWIIAIKGAGGVSLEEWKETELNLRGMSVRVGVIDPDKEGGAQDKGYPVARVFPYGGYKIKAEGKEYVTTRSKAEEVALNSLPDETTKIASIMELQKHVHRGYHKKPLQMPVVLLTDKNVTSPLFRAVALKYSKYFNFGVIHKPSAEIQDKLHVKQLPAIIVITAKPAGTREMITIGSVFYDEKAHGDLSYLNLARFIFAVHKKHWYDHPEAKKYTEDIGLDKFYLEDTEEILGSQDRKKEETKKESAKQAPGIEITFENHKSMCADSALGVCLIYFLDGGDKKQVKQALRLFKNLQDMPSNEDKPLHYLWVDAACHPEYGDNFGIFPKNLPALLLATPKQRLFKKLHGSVTKETLSDILSQIFLGKEDLSHYSRFNEMLSSDCQKVSSDRSPETKKEDKKDKEEEESKKEREKEQQEKVSTRRKTQRAEEL